VAAAIAALPHVTAHGGCLSCLRFAPGDSDQDAADSFVVHFFSMLSIWCVGCGLGVVSAKFTDYFLYLPIINSVTAVPITISGFGVREGMYIKMFHEVGVAEPVALVMSLLVISLPYLWSIVGGGFS